MTIGIDRRQLVQLGTFGLGALAAPSILNASFASGFTHAVASGEPSQHSVLLWTRFASAAETKLTAEVSRDMDFTQIIGGGNVAASPARDHIAKLTVTGLPANSWYYYRFIAPDGQMSPVGRTRTLPDGGDAPFRLGVFSCANMPFGYFNAYGHAAQHGQIDLAVHLGDYFYEYRRGTYPSSRAVLANRIIEPANEIIALADYRLRYASYRLDPDLQRLHQLYPMIAMWDDHEFANDAWQGGAQNHDEAEGDWADRRFAAEKAYREWMPVRDLDASGSRWSRYEIGNLATIHMTESRITGRSKQLSLGAALRGAEDRMQALRKFRDGAWQDPTRSMLGSKQESWLAKGFAASKAKWNIWAQQTIIGKVQQPAESVDWLDPESPPFVKGRVRLGAMVAKAGLPSNMDMWSGYPAARARALSAAQSADADLVVLTGDSHNAWAFDLDHDGKPAGVEMAGQSVSSPGFEYYLRGAKPADIAKSMMAANSELKWTDTSQRGYMTVTLSQEKVTSHWHFMATTGKRDLALAGSHRMTVKRGKRAFER
ncbi:MAG: alkaline phosphatase D family protein [Sphingorhabdus sp.]